MGDIRKHLRKVLLFLKRPRGFLLILDNQLIELALQHAELPFAVFRHLWKLRVVLQLHQIQDQFLQLFFSPVPCPDGKEAQGRTAQQAQKGSMRTAWQNNHIRWKSQNDPLHYYLHNPSPVSAVKSIKLHPVFDPRGSHQISIQAWLPVSLLRGN